MLHDQCCVTLLVPYHLHARCRMSIASSTTLGFLVVMHDKAIGIPNEVIHSVVKQQCLYEKLVMVYSICMKSDITFASVAARFYMYEFGR